MGTVIVFFISIYYYFSTINVLIALCKNHTSCVAKRPAEMTSKCHSQKKCYLFAIPLGLHYLCRLIIHLLLYIHHAQYKQAI